MNGSTGSEAGAVKDEPRSEAADAAGVGAIAPGGDDRGSRASGKKWANACSHGGSGRRRSNARYIATLRCVACDKASLGRASRKLPHVPRVDSRSQGADLRSQGVDS
eukprot:7891050-Pyramimonas_sp.AAC.1